MHKQYDTMKRVIRLLKPYWPRLILSLGFAVLMVIGTLYTPILIGQGIDLILGKGKVNFQGIEHILIKLVGVTVITSLTQWLMNLCNNRITYHIVNNVRTDAFVHLQKLPLKYIDSHQYGEMMSRVITDVEQFSDGLLMGFSQLFTGIITILGTLIFMLSIHFQISLIVILITPLSFFVAGFVAKKTYILFQKQSEVRAKMTSLTDEIVGNQKTVQIFGYQDRALKRFKKINEELKECSVNAIFFSSITNPTTRFINGLVYTGVGISGAVFSIHGGISVGQLASFLSYANQYTKPFNEISGVIAELQNALACANRVFDFMEEKEEKEDPKEKEVLNKVDGNVELKEVTFSYESGKELLKNLNLNVQTGQKIAIVGPTGCGKTTLINLLMRFYDIEQGEVIVSGRNIQNITKDSLRESYGMVLQDTWLKSCSIADNIAYGKPNATRIEIEQAAKKAFAHEFIQRMERGYDTVIEEDGGNLSQGQKQLICIARVMLKLPSMLILDEATSSIDTRTEVKVQNAFQKMMKGRTSFIVAHRLSTIQEADCILVMKDGNIIEKGKHEELLEQNGFYTKLYNSQFS